MSNIKCKIHLILILLKIKKDNKKHETIKSHLKKLNGNDKEINYL